MVSFGGTFVAISGCQGVVVMEMPLRWGVDGVYLDGKSQIICQTFIIHEHSKNQLECIQTRWHPNSPRDSHLLVLLSDNSIRMYDESVLKQIWHVGATPNNAAVEKNLSYLKSLGDTAVDFEIAPPISRKNSSLNDSFENKIDSINDFMTSLSIATKRNLHEQKKIEWPVLILRGNGTIFVLKTGFHSEKPRLQGPLTVLPSQKENYGDDSCSLLLIPTLPPLIVVAETSGILHHFLMIENSTEDVSPDDTPTVKNDWDLLALESIELELGLSEDNIKDTSTHMVLKRDFVNEQRYFCYHQTGLHGITVDFVRQLQTYANHEDETELNVNVRSRAEYILSTKAFKSSECNSVVGIGLLQSPSGIFAVLSSGQVVSLNIIRPESLAMIPVLPASQNQIAQERCSKNIVFDQYIKSLLNSGVKQPILRIDKSKPPSMKQAFELFSNATSCYKLQFARHDEVRKEIVKRSKILEHMKSQQKNEISQLLEDKKVIHEKAYKLADLHEDIMERQQNIHKRIQDVLRLASLKLASINSNEKEFSELIRKIKQKTDKLLQDFAQIKARNEMQKKQLEVYENFSGGSVLPAKQEETVKDILLSMTKQVANLTSDVKQISAVIDF